MNEPSVDWVALYKLGRLALLALALLGITVWVFSRSRKERLEEPARRMLEDDE
jgi:cbb3-type cytochrome oxidase subunit 3